MNMALVAKHFHQLIAATPTISFYYYNMIPLLLLLLLFIAIFICILLTGLFNPQIIAVILIKYCSRTQLLEGRRGRLFGREEGKDNVG